MLKPVSESYVRQGQVILEAVVKQPGWKIRTVAPGVCPSCDLVSKTLNVSAFGPTLDAEAENMIRANHIHESGHAVYSELPNAGNLVHGIYNALDDLRIEAALTYEWAGAGPSLEQKNKILHGKRREEMESGTFNGGPLLEALMRLMSIERGIDMGTPKDAKVQKYMDIAGAKFATWKNLPDRYNKNGAKAVINLAKEIADLLREAKKQEKQQEQDQEQEEKQNEDQQDDEKEQDSGQGNAGDTSDEGDDEDSDNGESTGGDGEQDSDSDEESGDSQDEGDQGDENEESEDGNLGSDFEDDDENSKDNGEGVTDSDAGEEEDDGGDSSDDNSQDSNNYGVSEVEEGAGEEAEQGKKDAPEIDPADIEDELNQDMEGDDFSADCQKMACDAAKDSVENDPDRYVSDTTRDIWRVPGKNDGVYTVSKMATQAVVGKLQRSLEQAMLAEMKAKMVRNLEEGELDIEALHHICRGTSKAVFSQVTKGKKLNTAVVIALDESGSMCSDGKIEAMRSLAIALGESLDRIGVPFEIIGASTEGSPPLLPGFDRTNPILYLVYKTFNERWTAVKTRLGTISARCNNVDGEFILNVGKRLLARREPRKILISLSDGIPEAGHNNSYKMGRNLINSCKVLRANGIEVYGFGILTEAPKNYYGQEWFVYAPRIAEMGAQFFRECVNIIQGRGRGAKAA